MRDIKRICRILNYLNIFWHRPECQDMRFWQMLNYLSGEVYKHSKIQDFFYLEDDEFEEILKKKILDIESS